MSGEGRITYTAGLLVVENFCSINLIFGFIMRRINYFLMCLALITGFACKEPYKPTIISSPNAYLVIEGVLNAGAGPTSIRLTRTFKLADTAHLKGELNAQIVVEGKDNTTRPLTMDGDGFYVSPNLNLTLNQEYRIRIMTANGKEYLSDYVVAKKTPVIDSVGWEREDKGVQVYVNAHDASNNTQYYRWDYDETWEIRSYYESEFKYVNGVVIKRTPTEGVYYCWKYDRSSDILLGSSARLASDIITRAPIAFFGTGDEKLAVRYSILLRQYALDKTGYEFYEIMKKNTESLGTIFDAQPSEMRGNIRCTSDPEEVVIGYISAATIEEKRIFISGLDLPRWNFYQDCPEILVRNHPDSIQDAYAGGGSIYSAVFSPANPNIITYYKASISHCVECPKRGGSLVRPSYW